MTSLNTAYRPFHGNTCFFDILNGSSASPSLLFSKSLFWFQAFLMLFLSCLSYGYGEAKTIRIYHVGNSLTVDSLYPWIKYALENKGYAVEQGFHIACGKGLHHMAMVDSNYTCITPSEIYSTWQTALATHEWDVITLQAFPELNYTGLMETDAAIQIISTALEGGRNKKCIFYLYLSWADTGNSYPPSSLLASFSDRFEVAYEGDNSRVFMTSGFMEYWFDRIKSRFPECDIRLIPTGKVLAVIDRKLQEIPTGLLSNSYGLYRDRLHMGPNGQYVAFMTMASLLVNERPGSDLLMKSLPSRSSFPSANPLALNNDFLPLANEVIEFTLASDSRTGAVPEPKLSIDLLKSPSSGDYLEIKFSGSLLYSTDFVEWQQVSGATSPFRNFSMEKQQFYQNKL